jgi:hypothetical protein
MALSLKSLIVKNSDCSCFTIFDASTDVPSVETITEVNIYVSTPDMTTPYVYHVSPTDIPNLFDPTVGVEICAETLGFGATFADNVYTIEYEVIVGIEQEAVTYTYTANELFICGIECCMRKARLQLPLPTSPCDKYEQLMFAELVLQGLYSGSCCGNEAYITEALTFLKDYCLNCTDTTITVTTTTKGCGCGK